MEYEEEREVADVFDSDFDEDVRFFHQVLLPHLVCLASNLLHAIRNLRQMKKEKMNLMRGLTFALFSGNDLK